MEVDGESTSHYRRRAKQESPLQRSRARADNEHVRPRLAALALLLLRATGRFAGDAVQKVTAVVKDLEGTVVVRS